ncbi:MAG: 3-deoxy-7-phosphoheptulonate synthase [Deltaproteobacteria bacterium]|nr:3-deoxy-7-phosphoheptulonate synthase [Deltaproteobacteria bacterium]MBW2415735.1 3-deoxy-7-phosphoheptulonate synthase [Deltaproteobacteria bacterium]
MPWRIDDVRIEDLRPLLPPAILMEEIPVGDAGQEQITRARGQIADVIAGEDDRLVVVVGPCSIHDPRAGLEYAKRLRKSSEEFGRDLLVVMRVYFEKPRTTVGWKGLINDPHLDGSFAINDGLRLARRFLVDVNDLGLATGTEFLDPITPQFIADLVSWGAIGARTSESQVHRELASGLSMPVGFKNGTDGTVQIAIDAISSSAHPHHFLSVTKQGVAAIVSTLGNPDCHVILRGGTSGANYSSEDVWGVVSELGSAGLRGNVMVDCSHANSGKDYREQPAVASDVAGQIRGGSRAVFGVMLESFLEDGRQDHGDGELVYGQSITDGCMGWERTVPVLEELADAVRTRRGGR